MSFNQKEEEIERFQMFGDYLEELNIEYRNKNPTFARVKKILHSMVELVENE